MVIIFIAQCAFYSQIHFLRWLRDSCSNKSYFRQNELEIFIIPQKWERKPFSRYNQLREIVTELSSLEMGDNFVFGQLSVPFIAGKNKNKRKTETHSPTVFLFRNNLVESHLFIFRGCFYSLTDAFFCVHKSMKQFYENPISESKKWANTFDFW